jgi:hypothetical protein
VTVHPIQVSTRFIQNQVVSKLQTSSPFANERVVT